MTNLRGSRVTILNNTRYKLELMAVFILGFGVGWVSHKLLYMIDDYLYGEPIGYLCKHGKVYEQADPVSTVYINIDKECIEGDII